MIFQEKPADQVQNMLLEPFIQVAVLHYSLQAKVSCCHWKLREPHMCLQTPEKIVLIK